MVKAIYTDKKGIYRDLYRTLYSENKQEKTEKRQPKGIYANLYRQLKEEEKSAILSQVKFCGNKNRKNNKKINFLLSIKNTFNMFLSKISYVFSIAAVELKFLVLAFMVAKKPINSYIKNTLPDNSNQGNYYNDR